jgi:putative peptide zinc metalloprotease protein
MQNDRFQTQNLAEAIAHAEAELARIDTRVAQLEVRSEMAGSVVLARQDDLPGTFLAKGQLLGYVLDARELIVRAAAPHEAAALIRERSRAANVWLEENHGLPVAGRMRRDVPAAMFRLPSAALSDRNGGAVVTDPADPEHLRTLAPVLLIDVALTPNPLQRIGGRAWVRFDFGDAPLAVQWAQALRQLLLQHFDTAV